MNKRISNAARRAQAGFTLIELLVVVLIIGILASIAVPQYFKVIEKGKAAEVAARIGAIKSAQERLYLKTGNYASAISALDINMPIPVNFNAPTMATAANVYTVSMLRNATPAGYGQYTVSMTFSQGGAGVRNGSMVCGGTAAAACQADLLP